MQNIIKQKMPFLTDTQAEKFAIYYEKLVWWNENRCNLTSITDIDGIIEKHFHDSILPEQLIPQNALCADVGTGAGFPGIPLKIIRPDINIVLIDSLKKRIDFLDELLHELNITAETYHARAEDAGQNPALRGKFDIALTRAVSQTNILLEWTCPLLKVGGKSLMYKSITAEEELAHSTHALSVLSANAEIVRLKAPWGERTIICAEKTGETPKCYPRKAGTAKKKPL